MFDTFSQLKIMFSLAKICAYGLDDLSRMELPNTNRSRLQFVSVVAGDFIYAFGGEWHSQELNSCERWDHFFESEYFFENDEMVLVFIDSTLRARCGQHEAICHSKRSRGPWSQSNTRGWFMLRFGLPTQHSCIATVLWTTHGCWKWHLRQLVQSLPKRHPRCIWLKTVGFCIDTTQRRELWLW